jgi:hypothetical protein
VIRRESDVRAAASRSLRDGRSRSAGDILDRIVGEGLVVTRGELQCVLRLLQRDAEITTDVSDGVVCYRLRAEDCEQTSTIEP